MDSSLLAAIQKGKGLKKSPRRPSTARRHSAAKPAASNATTTVSVCLPMPMQCDNWARALECVKRGSHDGFIPRQRGPLAPWNFPKVSILGVHEHC